MNYRQTLPATFISRPNRFIANVNVSGKETAVHVKNTGRCRELLIPGTRVFLCPGDNPNRKTAYDLVAVEKEILGVEQLINIDSQAPNAAAEEWLRSGTLFPAGSTIRREVTCGDSRFDFCVESKGRTAFIEVKGVTLERDGIALFPDAPTERGVKHINGLVQCLRDGMDAYILFVIQMKGIRCLRPNDETHRAFADALRRAAQAGVRVMAVDCIVTEDSMLIDEFVPVDLSQT